MEKYTEKEKIMIGKDVFNELLRTKYDLDVISEMQIEYGVSQTYIYNCFNKYKFRFIAPCPTPEEIKLLDDYASISKAEKFNKLKSNHLSKKLELLLNINSVDELIELRKTYNLRELKVTAERYIYNNNNEISENLKKKLLLLQELNNVEKSKKHQNKDILSSPKDNIESENYSKIEMAVRDYLESNDYYPHYFFAKYGFINRTYNNFLNYIKSYNPELYHKYQIELSKRDVEFSLLINLLSNKISDSTLHYSYLDFLRDINMNDKKFKLFLDTARRRVVIPTVVYESINNYLEINKVGSLKLDLNNALKLKYMYQNVIMTSEDIKEIYDYLNENDIQVCRNTIYLCFEDKVNSMLKTHAVMNK